ncbi:hypothetical protein AU255_01905 [Methyloprofundus sedimenti]|uniref:Band 7 domain-containing protein n=1 Tax=Methyloprofundus sedimenti TaxID=1420851 RepID=A0A1V8M563_9GAMM|nr:hypothetical protein [Methyloprofundus sedimenti]OQK16684.1 hypothetical protein AU255_01905 [Methyloprofundus sedimenti]
MNNPNTEIERWLIEGSIENDLTLNSDVWEVVFDEGRQLVVSDFGPFQKLYLRPQKFIKRFYHTLYPLPVEDWQVCGQIQLYDEFCTIDTQLDIRFQATIEYAQRQMENLPEINEHIKHTYLKSVSDQVSKHLLNLQNDEWVRSGLGDIENAIAITVSEMLMLENIEAQARCSIQATFIEFPDVQLGKEAVYLSVLKKNYEVSEEQRTERYRQELQAQQQQRTHQQKQLEQMQQDAELERQKQAQDAEYQRQLLLDQELLQREQFVIESRLHTDKIQHDNYLNDITVDVQLQAKMEQEKRTRNATQKSQAEELSHQALLKDQKLNADIEAFKHEQASWLAAKDKAHALELEKEQEQKKLKLAMEAANKKYEEQLQLEIQQEIYNNTKNSDIYLRREIELLELDKKRLELQLAIQESRKASDQS